LIEQLGHAFVQKAMLAGVCVGASCAFLGVFLVMRRNALFGDAVSHVAFGGVAVGLLAGVQPAWTAMCAAVIGGVGMQRLRRVGGVGGVSGDAAVAILLVGGLGVGVLAASATGGFGVDLYAFLFGSILLVSTADVAGICATAGVVVAALYALRRQLLHAAFSDEQARVAGVRVDLLGYAFIVLTSAAVVMSMRVVGILLVSALIVLPSITAIVLGGGFARTVATAVGVASGSVVAGIALAAAYNLAPSGAIVMVGIGALLAALARSRQARRRRRPAAPGPGGRPSGAP